MKNNNFFWVSFSDLMTSLFFVMLVLYVLTYVVLSQKEIELKESLVKFQKKEAEFNLTADSIEQIKSKLQKVQVDVNKLKEIENVEKALEGLSSLYFDFDNHNKRYKLKINATFKPGSQNIYDISWDQLQQLKKAGRALYNRLSIVISQNKNVDYLLVLEGNNARIENGDWKNWEKIPNIGYSMSYGRALALFNFWKKEGIDFRLLEPQCEIIIAGSGYFGQSRDNQNEDNNKRFTIQITSKIGKFLHQ